MTALLALPAITLVAILVGVVVLALVLASLTTRRPSDNGLVYEYQRIERRNRR